ncbi:MAG: hypothetical protein KJ666_18475 [Bacteroidetes bacterium]|nr:hypothetical protein [Bacteroidota bacterium]
MRKSEEYLEVLNHFVGYGNPNAQFLFMALEETGFSDKKEDENTELEKLDFLHHKYEGNGTNKYFYLSNESFRELPIIKKQNTYDGYVLLFNQLSGNENINIKDIGSNTIDLFVSNLYAIPKNEIYNNFIKQHVFIGEEEEWKKIFLDRRLEILRDFVKDYFYKKSKLIFCFGRSAKFISDYNKLFNSLFNSKIEINPAKKYEIIKEEETFIISLYHASVRNQNKKLFTKQYIDKIISDLSELL